MLLRRLMYRLRGLDPDLNDLPDRLGAAREWVVCPHCGAQHWRLPPHDIGSPCPVVETLTDSFGIKFDAERMLSVRAGQQMEQFTRLFEQNFPQPEEDDQ